MHLTVNITLIFYGTDYLKVYFIYCIALKCHWIWNPYAGSSLVELSASVYLPSASGEMAAADPARLGSWGQQVSFIIQNCFLTFYLLGQSMLHFPWLNFIVKSVSCPDNIITNSCESHPSLSKNVLTLRLMKFKGLPIQIHVCFKTMFIPCHPCEITHVASHLIHASNCSSTFHHCGTETAKHRAL